MSSLHKTPNIRRGRTNSFENLMNSVQDTKNQNPLFGITPIDCLVKLGFWSHICFCWPFLKDWIPLDKKRNKELQGTPTTISRDMQTEHVCWEVSLPMRRLRRNPKKRHLHQGWVMMKKTDWYFCRITILIWAFLFFYF